jgi:hypothetical protein
MVALVKCPDLLHPKSSVLMSGFNGASTLSCLSHPYFEKDTLQLKHFFYEMDSNRQPDGYIRILNRAFFFTSTEPAQNPSDCSDKSPG